MASISASLHMQARPDMALQSISPLKVRFYSKAALSLPISPFKGANLKPLVPQKKQQLEKFKISAVKASPDYLVEKLKSEDLDKLLESKSPHKLTIAMDGSAFYPEFLPQLPPGFRFHPTDEELLIHYLKNKVSCSPLPASIIAEIDVYKHDPWDLPAKACFGDQEWYFFSPRDRKYPNGSRPNRSAGSGYWKATGTEKPISVMSGTTSSQIVGVKKALVFFKGRPAKALKTSWVMHEYRLTETMPTNRKRSLRVRMLDDWVLCRIYKKATHSTRVFSNPELQAPSPADVPQESVMPKFSSFSGLFQSDDLFVDSFPSHDMSDASNAALSYVDPSYSLQVLPQHLNSCETRSHASMSMGFNYDEASSVYPAKRQNSGNQSSTLQFECWYPYMKVAAPDEHMYHWPNNENWNLELLPWERGVIV